MDDLQAGHVLRNLDAPPSDACRYKSAWHNHNTIVRSLVNTIADNGGVEIKRDYTNLSDMYHALGACRLVPFLGLASTAIYTIASQPHAIEHASLWRVAVVVAFLTVLSLSCFGRAIRIGGTRGRR
jgi:hypothetical protein